jgi:hypothetical protein
MPAFLQVYKHLRLLHSLQLPSLLGELHALVQWRQQLGGSKVGAGRRQHLQLPRAEACTLVLHQLLAGAR